jgi:O-antigen/teichoic acid export membrane protein
MSEAGSAVRRIFANLGLLLGGKAAAGLVGLTYVVIVARTLGAGDYGVLTLISGYATMVGGIVAFSGWHGLVRYGSEALEAGSHDRLLRVTRLMTLIELGFGVAACVIAALLAPLVGPHLGWPPRATEFAVLYSLSIFATVRATPQGLLQLAGRFDLIGAHQMIMPLVRLIGSVIVWQAGGGLIDFLVVWLISALAEGGGMWALGLWALRRMRLDGRLIGPVDGVLKENAGLLPFIVTTNLDLTLRDLAPRIAPLTVGWLLGPVAAGILALVQRACSVLQQPAVLLSQASYAVLARLVAAGDVRALRRTVWRGAAAAVAGSIPIVILFAIWGEPILRLIGGRSFSGGELLFVLIAAGRGLLLATPPLSAALTAMGRPSQSIMVNLAINLGLFPLLPPLLLIFGVNGAGWHGLLQAFVAAIWLAAMFRRATPRPRSGAILDD